MVTRAVLAGCLAGCLALGLGQPVLSAPPQHVVSMNLCTDQLAMLLAAPGQLVSVSHVARDPRASALADQAMAYPVNHGDAEEIYLAKPDLVLAAASSRAVEPKIATCSIPIACSDARWDRSLFNASARVM